MNFNFDDFSPFTKLNDISNKNCCAYEEDNNIIVKILAPELEKSDIDINVTSRILEIKSMKDDLSSKSLMMPIKERFRLTKDVDPDMTSAELSQGVLTVKMPMITKFHKRKVSIQ